MKRIRIFRTGIAIRNWHFFSPSHGTAVRVLRCKPGLFGVQFKDDGIHIGLWWQCRLELLAVHNNFFGEMPPPPPAQQPSIQDAPCEEQENPFSKSAKMAVALARAAKNTPNFSTARELEQAVAQAYCAYENLPEKTRNP